ncbi:hypothetical protein GCM10010168_82420 [Actinoplanes ianthinogenes]|nr:hypothetical protein GCM10010168_82420 [Actinoplanes ianthinogenes]
MLSPSPTQRGDVVVGIAMPMVPRSGCTTDVSAVLEQPVAEASNTVATTIQRMAHTSSWV